MSKNRYYVKPEAQLTLEIKDCSEATREALERQAAREGFANAAEYCADAVLSRLELDEDCMWNQRARSEAAKEREAET
jgi:hypothetical protein